MCLIFTTKDNQFAILGNTLDDLQNKLISFDDAFQQSGFWGKSGAFSTLFSSKKTVTPELLDEFKKFSKEFNSSSKSVQVLKEEFGRLSPEIENYAKTQKNGTLSLKGFTKSLNQNTLAAKAGQMALGGLAMAGNMIAMWAVTKVIELAATAIDNFVHRVEHAHEALENANSTYESTQSELSSITSELEEQEKALSDLQSKEKLTYAEQGQLEELQQITAELRIQQDILEKQAAQDRQDVANAAVKAFNTQYGNRNITDVDENQGRLYLSQNNDDIANVISDYIQVNKLLDETSQKLQNTESLSADEVQWLQDDYQTYYDMASVLEDNLNESLSNLENLRQSLAESYDENILKQQNGDILTTDQQDVIDTYQAIADTMRLIYQYTDPNQWNSMQMSDVFNTDGIERTKDELIEMAQAGELTPEIINGYKNLNSAIQQSELFLKDGQTAAEAFVDEIYAAAEAEEQLKNSAIDTGTASLSISETVDQLNLQVKPAFDALKSAWDEIFTDDGFELASANILEIADTIKSELDNYSELGLTIDYSAFEDFVRILEDTESTEEDVRQGFNELAQSIIEAGVTGLEDFETLKEALADLGVVNNEIVAFEALVNNTVALKEAGLDLATATDQQIEAFANEYVSADYVSQAIAILTYQKELCGLQDMNTATEVANLKTLAENAGYTGEVIQYLTQLEQIYQNVANGVYGTNTALAAQALRRADQLKDLIAESAAKVNYETPQIDFSGVGAGAKKAAGKAGKEAADEYKKKFEEELDDLQSLHDRGR